MTKATKATKTAAKAPVNKDLIVTVIPARDGAVVATDGNGRNLVRSSYGVNKEFLTYAIVGASFKALRTWDMANPAVKPNAKLANGIDSRTAPHSAKAVADQRQAANGAAAKTATTGKGKVRSAKADRAKQPSRGADRAYKNGKRADTSKPDTFRRYMLATIMGNTSTAAAKAAHAKSRKYPSHKLDFNWAAQQGYIVLGK